MSVDWEGYIGETKKVVICNKCAEFKIDDEECQCEKELIKNREENIDLLFSKKWWEFWK